VKATASSASAWRMGRLLMVWGTAITIACLLALLLWARPRLDMAIYCGAAALISLSMLGIRAWSSRRGKGTSANGQRTNTPPRPQPAPPPSDTKTLVAQMLKQGRYALLLRPEIRPNLDEQQLIEALETLMNDMSAVTGGAVGPYNNAIDLACDDEDPPPRGWPNVAPFYLDRCTVTNRQYALFVEAGGYDSYELWLPEVVAAIPSFVDRDGFPGPRYWKSGTYLPGTDDQPVVGISWYEAAAYARWVGKRLPADAEWQKAGSCPVMVAPGQMVDRRFPWGDAVDRTRINIWGSEPDGIVAVNHYAERSIGGVQQLVGNVWEWVADDFGLEPRGPRNKISLPTPMKAIRGGAFDTYFDTQATCQFQSGENPMARRHNIGFRLALSVRDLEMPPPQEE